jgi:hypothetical protein
LSDLAFSTQSFVKAAFRHNISSVLEPSYEDDLF